VHNLFNSYLHDLESGPGEQVVHLLLLRTGYANDTKCRDWLEGKAWATPAALGVQGGASSRSMRPRKAATAIYS